MNNEERMKMLQDIRDHLFWTGADADEENQDEFRAWVDFLDAEIEINKWFIVNLAELLEVK
jgi:hypothetical protein